MDVYNFYESPAYITTPCKKKKFASLMRHEIALSNSAYASFKREMSMMKIKFPFLTMSQIQGRTMDKFGIPNLMGRPYKMKFGSVTYSSVTHILYLIKKSMTEQKSNRKNLHKSRRHTIAGNYVPIEIMTSRFNRMKIPRSRRNLESKFALYSEENYMVDDNYSIESPSEISQRQYTDELTISEFESNYQSDYEVTSEPIKLRKTYERKSSNEFQINYYPKEKKKKASKINTNISKANKNLRIINKKISKINIIDDNIKGNKKHLNRQIEKESLNEAEDVNIEEVNCISDTNSFRSESDHDNDTEKKAYTTQDTPEEQGDNCNDEEVTKEKMDSPAESSSVYVVGKTHFKETVNDNEREMNKEINDIGAIDENVPNNKSQEIYTRKIEHSNKIQHSQDNEIQSVSSSFLKDSQKRRDSSDGKIKYLKQSIAVCSSEFLWQNVSQNSSESSSVTSEIQNSNRYEHRSRVQKMSIPSIITDETYIVESSQNSNLKRFKTRGYYKKTSECIIVMDFEMQTDSENNVSVDELPTNSGDEISVENKSLMINLPDHTLENSNDSASQTNDGTSTTFDGDNSQQELNMNLNVAFSPHFTSQNILNDSSDGYLTSQDTVASNSLRLGITERNANHQSDGEGYYLANLFDDDSPLAHQRTLRSSSRIELHSEDEEPTFVD